MSKVVANKGKGNDIPTPGPRPVNPLEQAHGISKLFYSWVTPMMKLGYTRPLEESDLWELSECDTSAACRRRMERVWQQSQKGRFSFALCLLWDYWWHMRWAQCMLAITMASRIIQSVALGFLIEQFGATFTDDDASGGYKWVGVLVACGFTGYFAKHQQFFVTNRNGMRTRAGLVATIYAKSLRLSSIPGTMETTMTPGAITNLASNDVERFVLTSVSGIYMFLCPFELVAVIYIGVGILGWVFLTGFVLIALCIPVQIHFGKMFATIRRTVAATTDSRVSLVSQAVSGIRVMKMNAWENQFESRIAAIRMQETGTIYRGTRYKAINEAIYFCSTAVIALVIFAIYVHTGGILTPRSVFTTISLLNLLQYSMMRLIPFCIQGMTDCYISSKRLQKLLDLPEVHDVSSQPTPTNADPSVQKIEGEAVLSMSDVTCFWNASPGSNHNNNNDTDNQQEEQITKEQDVPIPALQNIQLALEKGQLYCVVGRVGSGKSALLQCIGGELCPSKGQLVRNHTSLAYAAQEAWIMDGSVRENVTFGLDFRLDWYKSVLEACGLAVDIANFVHGDLTVVGDRGVQCSGGQRARIGLARAMYRDADLLLLDDPLSAVDSKVARWIFYSAIQDLAVKRGKCVVLVTHQHQFVGNSNCILMEDGLISNSGTYAECVEASNGVLKAALQTEQGQETSEGRVGLDMDDFKLNKDVIKALENDQPSLGKSGVSSGRESITDEAQKESRGVGIVTSDTWLSYLKAMGGYGTLLVFSVIFSSAQVILLVTIVEFGKWAEMTPEDQDSFYRLGLMIGLCLAMIVVAVGRTELSYFLFIRASRTLHDRITRAVLRSKIEFFDTNPLGRILNRFSADMGIVDELLPKTEYDFLSAFLITLGGVATAIAVLPFIILALPPLFAYFLIIRRVFLKTTRELKRLEGMARSPIFAMMSEALHGIGTIRSNGGSEYFQKKFEEVHNTHARAFFAFIASSRWFASKLDLLALLLLSMASTLAVVFHDQGWFNVDPAVLGLALTMLLQIAGTNFPAMVRYSAEVTNYMISTERLLEFGALEPEPPLVKKEDSGDFREWPSAGTVEANQLTVRYRKHLPPALNRISFKIEGGSKVGVVGRTGSGKSSLVQAMFRILEAEEGSMTVDGVDITKLGLHKLRTSMSVIPQSPVLFSGCTVRENLDPFTVFPEAAIREALESVQMSSTIDDLPQGLDHVVAEGGSNFSVGQRQLMCLARALLQKTRVLVLDEPTANVDSHTDQLLQQAVKTCFEGATIIAVAHRLDTIIDYDQILVLGGGKVLEFGTPKDLLSNKDGHFASMVEGTGEKMAELLYQKAFRDNK